MTLKSCPKCRRFQPVMVDQCPTCGHQFGSGIVGLIEAPPVIQPKARRRGIPFGVVLIVLLVLSLFWNCAQANQPTEPQAGYLEPESRRQSSFR